jgi:TorA maturation chaperone TorD
VLELKQLYTEFGYARAEDAIDRYDSLAFELEFVSKLYQRVAEADNELARRDLIEQLIVFFDKQLSWVDTYVERALPCAQSEYYRGFLLALQEVLRDIGEMAEEAA